MLPKFRNWLPFQSMVQWCSPMRPKKAFRVFSLTVSTTLLFSLRDLKVRITSNIVASFAFSLIDAILSLLTMSLWSTRPSLTTTLWYSSPTALAKTPLWSKSCIWLQNILVSCLFFPVKTMFVWQANFVRNKTNWFKKHYATVYIETISDSNPKNFNLSRVFWSNWSSKMFRKWCSAFRVLIKPRSPS